jgi:amidase
LAVSAANRNKRRPGVGVRLRLTPTCESATIADLQRLFAARRLTASTLVARCLERIDALDRHGPRVNSIIELNPDAPAIARELDRERRAGRVRGPLHGVPVLVKDNLATADRMSTTAGSLALAGVPVPRDAFVARRLRDAGAILLGKTNLSEWANFRSTRSTSGWSSRGGLTRNPHALDRSCSGSSSGTAAAIAAGFAVAGLGTETNGSIVSPASRCGIVGFKPTVGLVSRDGVIPIAASQDTVGPMTRTVADAAVLLDAIAARDVHDPATAAAPGPVRAVAALADPGAASLTGVRLGVVRTQPPRHEGALKLFDAALADLRGLGATLVEGVEMPARAPDVELEVLLHEFKAGIEVYLREFAAGSGLRTLADLADYNRAHADRVLPHFGQELFDQALARGGLDSAAYRDAHARAVGASRAAIDAALDSLRLDALVAPSGGPAWRVDLVNGDAFTGGCPVPAAVAGCPHVTVPMGTVSGLPVGLSLVAGAWRDTELLRYAFAYEQATRHRVAPAFRARS